VGNQREIRQVEPEERLGVLLRVRTFRSDKVRKLIASRKKSGRLYYAYFTPAGERLQYPNMDGDDVDLPPRPDDYVLIQSGGKMWCGYEEWIGFIRELAPLVEDALFFVADSEDYIDEFRIKDGALEYRRVQSGFIPFLEGYLKERESDGAA
jgi:hypothetical protein